MDTVEYYEVHSEKQMALIFLDAEKAFGNGFWQFIMEHLRETEAGEKKY